MLRHIIYMENHERLESVETRGETLSYTIELPGVEGPITVETNKARVGENLQRLAEGLGFDQAGIERIMTFFDEKVDIKFGKDPGPAFRGASLIDKYTDDFVRKVKGAEPLATVSPSEREGKWNLTIDLERIAQAISRSNTKSWWKVKNYREQTEEERIASLGRTLESVLAHELLHVIQLAENPEVIDDANRIVIRTVQVVAGSGLAHVLAASQYPELSMPITLTWLAACTVYTGINLGGQRGRPSVRAIEEEAYTAQRLAMDRGLMKDPFTITHEGASPSSQKYHPFISTIRPSN